MSLTNSQSAETNVFFETFLVTNKWSRFLYPILARLFFINVFTVIILTGFLFEYRFNVFNMVQNSTALTIIILAAFIFIFTTFIYFLSNKSDKKGALKIYPDHLRIITADQSKEFLYEEVEEIRFERHSTFHKSSGYEIPFEHGNKISITHDNVQEIFEFQITSKEFDTSFFEMIQYLYRKWPNKIVFTSV